MQRSQEYGQSPLFLAAMEGHLEAVQASHVILSLRFYMIFMIFYDKYFIY